MDNSPRLSLPFLAASQAQKHVTVNDSLARLDGLVHLALQSVTIGTPPALPDEGDCYGIPSGATNEWALQEGAVAIFVNEGWVFATPGEGWRAYVIDQASEAVYRAGGWVLNAVARSANGARTSMRVLEFDHIITAGSTSQTVVNIPAGAMIFGVSGIVTDTISGTLSTFSLGVSGSNTQFGSGLGIAQGSWIKGMLGSPTTYYSATPLLLTPDSGDFAAGTVRLSLHVLEIEYPSI